MDENSALKWQPGQKTVVFWFTLPGWVWRGWGVIYILMYAQFCDIHRLTMANSEISVRHWAESGSDAYGVLQSPPSWSQPITA